MQIVLDDVPIKVNGLSLYHPKNMKDGFAYSHGEEESWVKEEKKRTKKREKQYRSYLLYAAMIA